LAASGDNGYPEFLETLSFAFLSKAILRQPFWIPQNPSVSRDARRERRRQWADCRSIFRNNPSPSIAEQRLHGESCVDAAFG
jgi:hypothetical protein